MISFNCPCGKPFRFSLKFRGRSFRCNACGRSLVVPEESAKTGVNNSVPVASGDIITPVKPVLQLDLDSLPVYLGNMPPKNAPVHAAKKERVDQLTMDDNDDEDDEIIISGSLTRTGKQENVIRTDVGVDESEQDSTSTILSKAVISQQLKEEQEQFEAAQSVNAAPEQKPTKKAGLLSGFFKKKPAIPKEPKTSVPKKPKKEKRVNTSVVPPRKSSDLSQGKKIVSKILVLLAPILIVALGAFWFWEHTQVNAERTNVVKLKQEIERLNKQLNDLRKEQTPQATGDAVTAVDVPSDIDLN